ncbi:MAG TPA: class I SAM-dependent methyltransferase [Planctomycetota bacterium]|nr:class I SAM-dependent methyltransferase [Planctomycetota bacterium]
MDVTHLWDMDEGKRARLYAVKGFLEHYKTETYPIISGYLAGLGDNIRVLDIGAGPGNLAYHYFMERPQSNAEFVLLEIGQTMLDVAQERLGFIGKSATCVARDFNDDNWHEGLGSFDAIVSTNALFNLKPERLEGFYALMSRLLKPNGVFLNQQSCGYESEAFKAASKTLPRVIYTEKYLTPAERAITEYGRRMDDKLRRELSEKLKDQNVSAPGGYFSLHIPASQHIAYLQKAGFVAETIWRKMEFVIFLALKGTLYSRPSDGNS